MRIDINKEWSWIFTEGLGKAYGKLLGGNEVSIRTLQAAKPFFYFINDKDIEETTKISWSGRARGSYNKDFNPKKAWGNDWTPPPLQKHFSGRINPAKPILTIHNKYNKEWHNKPFNYISVEALDKIFTRFKNDYEIYYIRQDQNIKTDGYWDDFQGLKFGDYDLINEKHPQIITVYDYMKANNIGFNEAQLDIMGDTTYTIAAAGGNAVLAAYFGKDLIIYNHPNCKSSTRGIWYTDSWLKLLGNVNIFGFQDYDKIYSFIDDRW